MSLIDRAATFRGRVVTHTVNKSSGGFPQWEAQLLALEIYDNEEGVWVDWSEYDVNEITSYQVLFGGNKKETLAMPQIKKITGWDGNSFQALNDMDLSETGIQFRVETNVYKNKESLQVTWVDEYDAVPGRSVRKLNPEDLKELDAQYAQLLKKTTPAKATIPAGPRKVTKPGIESTQPKGPVKKKSNDPLGPPPEVGKPTPAVPTFAPLKINPGPPAPTPDPDLPIGHCTKDEAWNTVYDLKAKSVDDSTIAEIWGEAVREVAPKTEQKDITDEQWYKIKEIVAEKTAMF